MKKMFVLVTSVLFAATAVASSLEIVGSSTLLPVVTEASNVFTKNTGNVVIVKGGGSGFGIKSASEGGLGMASRSLKPEEVSAGLISTKVGIDGIAFIVNKSNPLKQINRIQAADIFSGKITRWKDLGGADKAINLLGPNSDHGTYDAFLDVLGIKGKIPETYKGFKSHNETMMRVGRDADAIGFVSVGVAESALKGKADFKTLDYDGVVPVSANVKNGTYKFVRELNMVTKGQPAGVQKDFVDFLLTPVVQSLFEKHDYVPVN